MKSPVTRDKYQKRLGKLFDFIILEGATLEDKNKVFVKMGIKLAGIVYIYIYLMP
jgi:hypothetical protein